MNNCLNERFGGAILKTVVLKEPFKVSCSETHFLREQFWSQPMLWYVFFDGAIILNFWFTAADYCGCCSMLSWLLISMAFVKSYSHLCAPIFIFFLSVRTYFNSSIRMNVKTSKVLIFFLLKILYHEWFFNQIMKTITITTLRQNHEY